MSAFIRSWSIFAVVEPAAAKIRPEIVILAVDRALEEIGAGDRPRRDLRFPLIARPGHSHFDQLRRPFPVPRDLFRQVNTNLLQRPVKFIYCAGAV